MSSAATVDINSEGGIAVLVALLLSVGRWLYRFIRKERR